MDAKQRALYHAAQSRKVARQIARYGAALHRVRAWCFHQRRALEWGHFNGTSYGRADA